MKESGHTLRRRAGDIAKDYREWKSQANRREVKASAQMNQMYRVFLDNSTTYARACRGSHIGHRVMDVDMMML